MNPINEQDFNMSCVNGLVESVVIEEVESGHIITMHIKWKEGVFTLYTQRNRPRSWSSLNTLVDFLKRQGLRLPTVTLTIRKG